MAPERCDWYGLYGEGWGQEIVPEAFSHPAKFARGLIRRIYAHALEQGYLKEGDTVLDPFAGVALGGLDAMFHGLYHIGCELEARFVDLGQQNIDLWNLRYGNGKLPRWGTAIILQGDSRDLARVLAGARAEGFKRWLHFLSDDEFEKYIQGIIASPPWDQGAPSIPLNRQRETSSPKDHGGPGPQYVTGTDPANLGNMPAGDVDAVIASPPGLEGRQYSRHQSRVIEDQGVGSAYEHRIDAYGDSDGQLAALPEGEPPQGIVSSPPWASCEPTQDDGFRYEGKPLGSTGSHYGESRYQLYNEYTYMSPEWIEERRRQSEKAPLSRLPLEAKTVQTFWEAAHAILLQCHQVLAPGGHAIWVLKDFIRAKKRVDFTGQWRSLCEACGFETVEIIRAWLVEDRGAQFALDGELVEKQVARKSFFRRLHESKYPHLSIDYEVVLVTRKV